MERRKCVSQKRFSQFILCNFYNVALHFVSDSSSTPQKPLPFFTDAHTTLKKRIDMLEKPGKSNKSTGLDWIEPKGIAFYVLLFSERRFKGCTDFRVSDFPGKGCNHWGKLCTVFRWLCCSFPCSNCDWEQIRVLNDHYEVFTSGG